MIPFLIKSLTFGEPKSKSNYDTARLAYKLWEIMSISYMHREYYNRYYLYNCLVYGFNPRQEIFRISRRWKFFEHQIPKELK